MSATVTPTSDLNTSLGSSPDICRLYDNVQVEMPAVTLSAIKMAAWNTIEDFYLRSTVRRAILDWSMIPGIREYDFNPFDETWLVAWVLGLSGLVRWHVRPPATIFDMDPPTSQRSGQVLLALKPIQFSDTNIPSDLFQQWFEAIKAGTLMRLYRQPAKPYSSPQEAMNQGREYARGIAQARATADEQYSGGRWMFPRHQGFALGRRKQ